MECQKSITMESQKYVECPKKILNKVELFLVHQASLPLAKLCAMVTMQKQGEASSQTFSLSLMSVPVEGHAPRQARALDTGLLDLTIKYRKTTAESSQLGYTAQEDHVCIAVEVSRACGLKVLHTHAYWCNMLGKGRTCEK